jgi:hypothetical protein
MNAKWFSALSVYVLPLPVFAGMAVLWRRLAPDPSFFLFVMLMPVLYGYIVPGIATNALRKWRFRGRFLMGRYYIHHGFMYGSKMAFLLYAPFVLIPRFADVSVLQMLAVILMNGLMCAVVFWYGDIQLVRAGMVEIDSRAAREGRSPEAIVTAYAPLSFFLIGAAYAAGALLAYRTFVIAGDVSVAAQLRVWGVGSLLLFTFPSIAYHLATRKSG